jgi:hypothetical protein
VELGLAALVLAGAATAAAVATGPGADAECWGWLALDLAVAALLTSLDVDVPPLPHAESSVESKNMAIDRICFITHLAISTSYSKPVIGSGSEFMQPLRQESSWVTVGRRLTDESVAAHAMANSAEHDLADRQISE